MPELPEVETTGRGIAARLLGRTIVHAEQRRADLRRPMPRHLPRLLEGRTLLAVTRRAKYLLLRFDTGDSLLLHLGMSGRVVIADRDDGARGKHDHVVLVFDDGAILRFNDARRFGLIEWVASGAEDTHPLLVALGPEPLPRSFTPARLAQALTGRKTAIKQALLDQAVVAGLGNIYVCEALFAAAISPLRPACSLTGDELARLVPAIKNVLQKSLKAGGSSLRDYVQASGELGYFQTQVAVYGREGQPCPRCGKCPGILRAVQGGRSTFWCAACQS